MKSSVQMPTPLNERPLVERLPSRPNQPSTVKEMPYALFSTIPPERIGLNGEYDHNGLSKRVLAAFRESVAIAEIEDLRVTQRGRVVILMGRLPHSRVLAQLRKIAMSMDGTGDVETTGIRIS
ncbi:MAG: hypothetical protein KME43_03600 [Myxacorys chilensis ATA2-1-KO14]|jgi:hypothetical protein|nr:hypothetical protein [Myxacorys chilensis ATA2-1-KO14]